MARPLRIERVGGWYHVTSRGNERKAIYRNDRDRLHFLELLEGMVETYRVRMHTYVLMDNHFHLMLELTETNLSRAIQWLQVSYSVWFNRRHRRSGHLFQGRFKSVAVEPATWGLELSRYVHLNPVRIASQGLDKRQRAARRSGLPAAVDAAQVRERLELLRRYRWSSYRAYAGLESAPAWLECDTVLGLGGGPKKEQRRRYREYVEKAVREGLQESPWESVKEQLVLGGKEFLSEVKQALGAGADGQEQRGARRLLTERPSLEAVIAAVECVKGEGWPEFRDRHGDRGRDLVLYLGRKVCGMKLTELAEKVEVKNYAAVSTSVRRYERGLMNDKVEAKRAKRVLQMLNTKICPQ
jgi:putative transposase